MIKKVLKHFLVGSFLLNICVDGFVSQEIESDIKSMINANNNFRVAKDELRVAATLSAVEFFEGLIKMKESLKLITEIDYLDQIKNIADLRAQRFMEFSQRLKVFKRSINALMGRDYNLPNFPVEEHFRWDNFLKDHEFMNRVRDFIDQMDGVTSIILDELKMDPDSKLSKSPVSLAAFCRDHTKRPETSQIIHEDVHKTSNTAEVPDHEFYIKSIKSMIDSSEMLLSKAQPNLGDNIRMMLQKMETNWKEEKRSKKILSISRTIIHFMVGKFISEVLRKENVDPIVSGLRSLVSNLNQRFHEDSIIANARKEDENITIEVIDRDRSVHQTLDAVLMAASMAGQLYLETIKFCAKLLYSSVDLERWTTNQTRGTNVGLLITSLDKFIKEVDSAQKITFVDASKLSDFPKMETEFRADELEWLLVGDASSLKYMHMHRLERRQSQEDKMNAVKNFALSWYRSLNLMSRLALFSRQISQLSSTLYGNNLKIMSLGWSDPNRYHKSPYKPPATKTNPNPDDSWPPSGGGVDDDDGDHDSSSFSDNDDDDEIDGENDDDEIDDENDANTYSLIQRKTRQLFAIGEINNSRLPKIHFPYRTLIQEIFEYTNSNSENSECAIPLQTTSLLPHKMTKLNCISSVSRTALHSSIERIKDIEKVFFFFRSEVEKYYSTTSLTYFFMMSPLQTFFEEKVNQICTNTKTRDASSCPLGPSDLGSIEDLMVETPMMEDAIVRVSQITQSGETAVRAKLGILGDIHLGESIRDLLLVTSSKHLGSIGISTHARDLVSLWRSLQWSDIPGSYWSFVLECNDLAAKCIQDWKAAKEEKERLERVRQVWIIIGWCILSLFVLALIIAAFFWKIIFRWVEQKWKRKALQLNMDVLEGLDDDNLYLSPSPSAKDKKSAGSSIHSKDDFDSHLNSSTKRNWFERITVKFKDFVSTANHSRHSHNDDDNNMNDDDDYLDSVDNQNSSGYYQRKSVNKLESKLSKKSNNGLSAAILRRKSAAKGVGADPRKSFITREDLFSEKDTPDSGQSSILISSDKNDESKNNGFFSLVLSYVGLGHKKKKNEQIHPTAALEHVDQVNEFLQDFDDYDHHIDTNNQANPSLLKKSSGIDSFNTASTPGAAFNPHLQPVTSVKPNGNNVVLFTNGESSNMKKEMSRAKERASIHDKLFPVNDPLREEQFLSSRVVESSAVNSINENAASNKLNAVPQSIITPHRRKSRKMEIQAVENVIKKDQNERRARRKSVLASVWSSEASEIGDNVSDDDTRKSIKGVNGFVARVSRAFETFFDPTASKEQEDYVSTKAKLNKNDNTSKNEILTKNKQNPSTSKFTHEQKVARRSNNFFDLRGIDDEEEMEMEFGAGIESEESKKKSKKNKDVQKQKNKDRKLVGNEENDEIVLGFGEGIQSKSSKKDIHNSKKSSKHQVNQINLDSNTTESLLASFSSSNNKKENDNNRGLNDKIQSLSMIENVPSSSTRKYVPKSKKQQNE